MRIATFLALVLCAACGQSGDLYLPDRDTPPPAGAAPPPAEEKEEDSR